MPATKFCLLWYILGSSYIVRNLLVTNCILYCLNSWVTIFLSSSFVFLSWFGCCLLLLQLISCNAYVKVFVQSQCIFCLFFLIFILLFQSEKLYQSYQSNYVMHSNHLLIHAAFTTAVTFGYFEKTKFESLLCVDHLLPNQ